MLDRVAPIRIAVSACLLGDSVRYDGRHKYCDALVSLPSARYEWIAICPEVELGMGVPREPIELTLVSQEIRLLGRQSRHDWTDAMRSFARDRIAELVARQVRGFVLKSRSPSCGRRAVKVVQPDGSLAHAGIGLFAKALRDEWPEIPVEDELGIEDEARRRRFLSRVTQLSP